MNLGPRMPGACVILMAAMMVGCSTGSGTRSDAGRDAESDGWTAPDPGPGDDGALNDADHTGNTDFGIASDPADLDPGTDPAWDADTGPVEPLSIPFVTPPWDDPYEDRPYLQEDNSNSLMDAGYKPLIAVRIPAAGLAVDGLPERVAPRGRVVRATDGTDVLESIPTGDPDLLGAGIDARGLLMAGPARLYVPGDSGPVAHDIGFETPEEALAGLAQGIDRVLVWTPRNLGIVDGPDAIRWFPMERPLTAVLDTPDWIFLSGTATDGSGAPVLWAVAAAAFDPVPDTAAPVLELATGASLATGTIRAMVPDVTLPVPLDLVVAGDLGVQGFRIDTQAGHLIPVDVALFAPGRVPLDRPAAAVRASDGGFILATQGGACRVMDRDIGPEWRVYNAHRWVPDGDVRGVATDPGIADGPIWFATAGGLAKVTARRLTLETKIAGIIDRIVTRHDRDGALADSRLAVAGDLSTSVPWDSDNDGGWTCYWVLSECFRWKVTGDPQAKAHFDRSLERMLSFRTLTGTDWFLARSVIRKSTCVLDDCDNPDDGEWFTSPDGEWWVKSDTSNDEVTSHMFMMGHAYDLCADDTQKAAIRDHVGGIVGGLVDHGFQLLNPDGEVTSYGQFDPNYVNGFVGLMGDGGRRSVQMLAALDLALYMTGDEKFAEAKRTLIDQHHYHENVVTESEPPGRVGNGDGDELGTQAFFVLLRYETDPGLYAMYKEGWRRTYGNMRLQQAALWDVISGVLGGEVQGFDHAARWLKGVPTDGIRWTIHSIQRKDLMLPPEYYRKGDDRWARSDGRILPPDERPNIRHNSSQYQCEGGWGSNREIDGADIVAAYWMARYHGFIVPQETPDH